MQSQLTDYDFTMTSVPFYCHNTSAITISNNPVMYPKTKHIEVRYHFICDHVLKKHISLEHVATDMLTKPLPDARLSKLLLKLDMLNCSA